LQNRAEGGKEKGQSADPQISTNERNLAYLPAISEATLPRAVVVVAAASRRPFSAFLTAILGNAAPFERVEASPFRRVSDRPGSQ
jgi:hypothetical protein